MVNERGRGRQRRILRPGDPRGGRDAATSAGVGVGRGARRSARGWRVLLDRVWYGRHPANILLAPLSWVFHAGVALRKYAYSSGLLSIYRASVPVIVVGNVTVGGSGKTPLVIWLAGYLQSLGLVPGIVARGYGGRASRWPQQVRPDSDPETVGDEAVVIARRTRCPVAVAPSRPAAVAALVEYGKCDVVISDDGLQHYGLARDIEIAVVDGVRRLGNGRLLPAGPLREPPQRLREVDFVVTNGIAGRGEYAMRYVPVDPINLVDRRQRLEFGDLHATQVHAVCGIGNPERFFQTLKNKGLRIIPHAFPDHHRYRAQDLAFDDDCPILMTEKDAVKCERFGIARCWSVPVTAELPEVFAQRLRALLMRGENGQEIA